MAAGRAQTIGADSNSERRQEVLDAAARCFARHGYHGVSTRALADELGIKVASLYFHVKSKDQALQEVCERGVQPALDFTRATLQQPAILPDRLRFYFGLMRQQLHSDADYVNVFVNERRHLSADARKQIEGKLRSLRRDLLRIFEEAREQGDLHESLTPRHASYIMIGTIRHLTQFHVEGQFPDFDAFMDAAVEALIRGLVQDAG